MELLSFKLLGMSKLANSFKTKQKKLQNNKPAFARCVVTLDKWIQLNFRTEGDKVGGWKPLTDATIYSRRHGKKANNSTKILQDVGELRKNWKHKWTNFNGYIQSEEDYGEFHNKGKGVPQRRIIPEKHEMVDTFRRIFNSFIGKILK